MTTRLGIKHPEVKYPGYLDIDDLAKLWGMERAKLKNTIRKRTRPKELHFPEPDQRGDHNKPLWKQERLEELDTWWKLFNQRTDTALVEGGPDIRSLRRAAGLTQLEAAKRVGGLRRSGWGMFETGRVETLDCSRAEQIATALGTDAQTIAEAHARTRARRQDNEKCP